VVLLSSSFGRAVFFLIPLDLTRDLPPAVVPLTRLVAAQLLFWYIPFLVSKACPHSEGADSDNPGRPSWRICSVVPLFFVFFFLPFRGGNRSRFFNAPSQYLFSSPSAPLFVSCRFAAFFFPHLFFIFSAVIGFFVFVWAAVFFFFDGHSGFPFLRAF